MRHLIFFILLGMANSLNAQIVLIPRLPATEAELDNVLDKFNRVTLPQLELLRVCATMAEYKIKEAYDLQSLLFGKHAPVDSITNMVRLYEKAMNNNQIILTELRTLVKKFNGELPSSPYDLAEVRQKFDQELGEFVRRNHKYAGFETNVLEYIQYAMSRVSRHLHENMIDMEFVQQDYCRQMGKVNLAVNQININYLTLNQKALSLKTSLEKSRAFKNNLIKFASQSLRLYLFAEFSKSVKGELDEVAGALTQAIQFSEDYQNALNIIQYGDSRLSKGQELALTYRHFTIAQRELFFEIESLKSLKSRFNRFTATAVKEAVTEIKVMIDQEIGERQKTLDRVNELGWEGQFGAQKAVVAQYVKKSDRLTETCLGTIKAFQDKVPEITDGIKYNEFVKYFAAVKDGCG